MKEEQMLSKDERDVEPDLQQQQASHQSSSASPNQPQTDVHVQNLSIENPGAVFLGPVNNTTVILPGKQNVPGTPDPDQVQAVGQKANKALKKKYTSTGSYIQMLPLVDDSKRHIMDIYTKLCLDELVDTREKIHHKKINSCEEIFHFQTREGYPIKRIVVSGSAGIGKTTLIDKVAYDWARGNSETLNKFKLVFALKMHSLQQSSNLEDAIFSEKLLTKDCVDQSALKEFVDKNQDKVLILLDGFDEFKFDPLHTSSFGSILNILNRKLGPEYWVVITSRPPLDKLINSSLVEKPYAHVRVEGFSHTDKEEYVNKFFTDDHVKASKLTEQIKQSETLSDLAKSPMLLLLMCLLMGSTKNTLPHTMTRLYNKALKYIFKRKTRDIKDDAISKILISIGKVALGSLLSKDQSFAFREGDFEKSALDAAINAGVLTNSSLTADNTNQILSSLASPSTLIWLNLSENKALGGCASIWGPELGKMECLQDIDLQNCSLQGTDIEPIAVALSGVSTLVELDLSWNQDLGGCAKMWAQHLKGIRHLEEVYLEECGLIDKDIEPIAVALSGVFTLAHLNLNDNDALGGCASLWAQHLKKMNHLKELTLMACNLTGGDMKPIAESVSDMPNLIDLDLSDNDPLSDCASFWAPHLKLMTKHLKKLEMWSGMGSKWTDKDKQHINASIGLDSPILELL
ncbi:protein NLRC5-like [Asterias rubens]|uniref:protein NLRC5-like n=1 Tax=Asterias rubens TaxID=7604 RepID=UPI0014555EAC|nr:protein NLRC5-like [Asterias rubens]